MNTERIVANACLSVAGLDRIERKAIMRQAMANYQRYLEALVVGDEELGIFGSEGHDRLTDLNKSLSEEWSQYRLSADYFLTMNHDDRALLALTERSKEVLRQSAMLVSETVDIYGAGSASELSLAMTIDIAGRQRMLAQRLVKDICFINVSIGDDAATAQLMSTHALFERSLEQLQSDLPKLPMSEARRTELSQMLGNVAESWSRIAPWIAEADVHRNASSAELIASIDALDRLTAAMNEAVKLYAAALDSYLQN